MPVYTPTPHATDLATLRADLQDLAHPHSIAVRQRIRAAGRRRNVWRPLDHDPLLQQLRAATRPGSGGPRGPERRAMPRSRPACALDPLDVLAEVTVALSGWVAGLDPDWTPPAGADYQLAALRWLAADARRRTPETVQALTADAHRWWHAAATWSCCNPAELIAVRRTPAPDGCVRCCPRCTPRTRCDQHQHQHQQGRMNA